ncbi:hypothetical protein DL764_003774 [Monosporascus ibericus]|uniref:Zn(2)-C6 fungal-type domain-containing protein n=1 Tax=Monosporascus ibericus TaxID=155417 RepID=A0A4Q4THZ3_9PEZI|nr:hypothetical protein DL764_003774 [Monosporascus ibericus]
MITRTPVTEKWTRSSTPRGRTGCQTCRKRRVKCDETRPSCLRCVQARWKCDGYGTSTGDKTPATRVPPKAALSVTSYSIPFRVPGSQKDRQMLHYFCVQGSHDIAGFLSSDFWSRTILQESHQDPVVRHALVSLSSVHLDYVTANAPGNGTASPETLVQYGKALRILRNRISNPSKTTTNAVLVCCILFYCFEATLGNSEAAVRHLDSGLRMLSSCRRGQIQANVDHLERLSDMFERLDLQATIFDDGRVPLLTSASNEHDEETRDPPCEGGFSLLEDGQRTLVKLQGSIFSFLSRNVDLKCEVKELIPANILQEKDFLMQQYSRWLKKFDDNRPRAGHDGQAVCGIQTLLIQFHVSRMLVASSFPADDSVFGSSPNETAEAVLQMAENILRLTGEGKASVEVAKNPRRNLSSETGIVAPLFLLAMKCSDESVCSRAAELLATSQRREGLYDAQTMARIIGQLQDLRAKRQAKMEGYDVEQATNTALEHWIPYEIERAAGGMDRLTNSICT